MSINRFEIFEFRFYDPAVFENTLSKFEVCHMLHLYRDLSMTNFEFQFSDPAVFEIILSKFKNFKMIVAHLKNKNFQNFFLPTRRVFVKICEIFLGQVVRNMDDYVGKWYGFPFFYNNLFGVWFWDLHNFYFILIFEKFSLFWLKF